MELKLRNVRIAFCQNLFEPGVFSAGDKPAWSSTFILTKDDEQNKHIKAVIQNVAVEKWQNKGAANLKTINAAGNICYRDGDIKSEYDGFEGNMYIAARNTKRAPAVFDRDKTELTAKDGKPYAGCYVNVKLDIWAQDNNYGKRINATLLGVQFVKDGDAFSASAVATADDFDDIADIGDEDAFDNDADCLV